MVKFAMFSASGVKSIKVAIGEIDVINCNGFGDTIMAIRCSKIGICNMDIECVFEHSVC